ncbi:MAG: ComF family protein [Rikenellaceae bacterium]|nr:ComF family protein [Rikenellaceae bacterium]
MLILNKLRHAFSDMWYVLFPPACPVCNVTLREGEQILCNHCRAAIPMTGFIGHVDNAMERRLWGLTIFEHASALFFYIENSPYRRIIHEFKYNGKWFLAREMGEWFGGEILRAGAYPNIDVIIPVPLHPLRRLWRGYNQSEYLAEGLSRVLEVPVDRRSLRRHSYTTSQTRRTKNQRWDNVHGRFRVRRGEQLAGRHILLVDDVFTTGATICACAEAIRAVAPDCRISVATLTVSQREVADLF